MKIGPVIRKLRKEKSATLEQIALIAGTDPGNLSKVERDLQQLTPDMLENVAKALEMPISSLYLIVEQTSLPHVILGSKKEATKEIRRLEDFVTRFMLLTPEHQLMVNEFIAVMLKSQGKID
ncbi:MAG: helix-turn-helix transcriptional regulator [Burkholderiales bacterium]|nr:helix-turn-helix transcriptional regulator [Burkholderiales bacterium]